MKSTFKYNQTTEVSINKFKLTNDPCRPTNDTFKMYFKRRGPIDAEFISVQSLYGMPPQTSLYSWSSACAIAKTASTESHSVIG